MGSSLRRSTCNEPARLRLPFLPEKLRSHPLLRLLRCGCPASGAVIGHAAPCARRRTRISMDLRDAHWILLQGFQVDQLVVPLVVVIRKLRGEGAADLLVKRPRVPVGLFRRRLDHEEAASKPPDLVLDERHDPAAVPFPPPA